MAKAQFVFLCGVIAFCSAIDIELAKEGPCLNPSPKSAKFDVETFQDNSVTWYTPLISKYELYRIAEDLTGKNFEDITDKDLKKSCILFNTETMTSFCMTGFGGGKKCYDMTAGEGGSFVWKARGHDDWDGESWITKVGKDYMVGVTCWSSGQRTFAVSSRTKTLNPSVKAEILEHVKSLGFNSKYIYESSNDEGCDDAESNTKTRDDNEL